jgi:hypothetical protein
MKVNELEVLLEKYWNAETSQSEEAQLSAYFNSEDINPEFLYAKSYFIKKTQGLDITTKIIHKLIDKYFEAETTVEDEGLLKEYFAQDEVHSSLKQYKMLFNVYNKAASVQYLKELSLPKVEGKIIKMDSGKFENKKVIKLSWLKTAAAAACIGIVSFFVLKNNQAEQVTTSIIAANKARHIEAQTPEEALEMTKAALAMVSKNYRKGENQLFESMKTMNQATDLSN